LEDAFWHELRIIAAKKGVGISKLVSTINDTRTSKNLSSAIRLFVLDHYRANTSSTG
jgi:predicted DNA-binding ribbon-helix-helix protein